MRHAARPRRLVGAHGSVMSVSARWPDGSSVFGKRRHQLEQAVDGIAASS